MANALEIALVLEAHDRASTIVDSVQNKLGTLGTVGIAAGAAVAGALVGAGVALFKFGSQFDEVQDTIRLGTGATGAALDGLVDDFRAVARNVPADMGQVSQVIADLNTRTGLTGESLQDLASTTIQFARITGGDTANVVRQATRLFGDWSIASEDQAGALDKLWRASQATGIGVDALMGKVVQFGAPLRAMGFSFEESAALMGKWEKEGVNAELILGSLRIAMGNFAEQGVPMRQGLEQTIARITELGPSAEATSLAMKTFGARAGPDMAAAILEGRFALGDLLEQVANGSETVLGAAGDVADFGERWQLFMNRARFAVEPLAKRIFELAGTILDRLAPAFEEGLVALTPLVITLMDQAGPAFDAVADAVTLVAGAVRSFIPHLEPTARLLSAIARVAGDNLVPILASTAAVLTATLVPAFLAWAATAKVAAAATIAAMWPVALPLTALAAAVFVLTKAWTENWGDIQGKTAAVVEFISTLPATIGGFFDTLGTNVHTALTTLGGWIEAAWQGFTTFISDRLTDIHTKVTEIWNAIPVDIREDLVLIGMHLREKWGEFLSTITMTLGEMWKAITDAWNEIKTAIGQSLSEIGTALSTSWAELSTAATETWNGIASTIGGAVGTAWEHVSTWATDVLGKLKELATDALNAAKGIGSAIIDGITGMIADGVAGLKDAVGNMVRSALDAAKSALGVGAPRAAPRGGSGFGAGGPPIVGGDFAAPATAGSESAIGLAMRNLGSQSWNWMCQKFVENMFGTGGRYASARDAAAALMTNRGGTPPRGALTFFAPDPTNAGFGHVGISLGGGQFVSATANGVKVDSLADSYWGRLFQGFGLPRFAAGVRNFGGGLALVGEEGPEIVGLPRGSNVYSNRESQQMMGNPSITVNLNGPVFGADKRRMADELANEIWPALVRLKSRNGGLGLA